MEPINLNNIAEEQLKQILDEVQQISDELDVDISDVDKDALLGGPLDNIQMVIDGGRYAIGKYNEIVAKGGILGDGKQVVIDEINKMKGVFKAPKGANPPNRPGGPGGPRSYDTSGGERAKNVQATGAKPIDVKFDTDITERTFGDIDLYDDKDLRKYPLVMSRQVLDFQKFYGQDVQDGQLVYTTNALMAAYINSIVNKLNNIAQANVNFATSFTYEEITIWLTVLCGCLNAYYGIYSIIQFEEDPDNKNRAMENLRRNISAEDFNYLDVFTKDLMSVPMPEKLPKLFYMLNANYRFEELPKSPIIKFTSGDVNSSGILTFDIPAKIKSLNEKKFRDISRRIFRALPTWRRQELPMYGPETYHSRNFNTIFMNSGHTTKASADGRYYYSPTFDPQVEEYERVALRYYSNANDLDGLTTSMFAVHDKTVTSTVDEDLESWLTGLFKPQTFTKFSDNRAVYYDNALHKLDSSISHRIPFVNELNQTDGSQYVLGFGVSVEQIYGLSIVALRQMSKEFVDWIFELKSIPIRDLAKGSSDKTPSRRTRSRKRKGKSKFIGKEEVKEFKEVKE